MTDLPEFPYGVAMRRGAHGSTETNVPWIVRHHSPTGFEWGYGGSGPADLSLNILEAYFRMVGWDEPGRVKCWDGTDVFQTSWDLRHKFKFHFIARIPREGGFIPMSQIEGWIEEQIGGQE